MDLPATLGHKITARRKQLGVTREELAEAIGVTAVAVGQWESGRTKNLKLDHVTALEDALNIKLRWLVENKGPMEAYPTMDAYRQALGRRDEARDYRQKKAWERIAAVFAKAAMVLMFTIPPYMMPQAEAGSRLDITPRTPTKCTMSNRWRRRFSTLLTRLYQIRTARVVP